VAAAPAVAAVRILAGRHVEAGGDDEDAAKLPIADCLSGPAGQRPLIVLN